MFNYVIKADDDKALAVKSEKNLLEIKKYINQQIILDSEGNQILIVNNKEYKNPKVLTKDDFSEYMPHLI